MFLSGGAAVAWPLAAGAQQAGQMRRIGVLAPFAQDDPLGRALVIAFEQGLEKLGWTIGRNVRIDYRWGIDDAQKAQAATADLLAAAPDVIMANTSRSVATLRQATRTVPVVFTMIYEPVAQGFVRSLAHPGANITGFTMPEATMGAKWLELLKEIAPQIKRVAFLSNPENPGPLQYLRSVESAAPNFAVEAVMAPVHGPAEIETTMAMLARAPGGGLISPPDGFLANYANVIVELAARYRLPAIYGIRDFATDGGLVSYGINPDNQMQEAAGYVDRILRGEKPGDLPVQQPAKFELVINLKTAKALGLTVPPLLLGSADEVIE
ncbi:MAG TPA: ABC transporter substrate-binding protein [Alphaproteobacteria bacterium]|nr:ABC transporter substrate-binding protein [Alphaproteobacteria bacterium]